MGGGGGGGGEGGIAVIWEGQTKCWLLKLYSVLYPATFWQYGSHFEFYIVFNRYYYNCITGRVHYIVCSRWDNFLQSWNNSQDEVQCHNNFSKNTIISAPMAEHLWYWKSSNVLSKYSCWKLLERCCQPSWLQLFSIYYRSMFDNQLRSVSLANFKHVPRLMLLWVLSLIIILNYTQYRMQEYGMQAVNVRKIIYLHYTKKYLTIWLIIAVIYTRCEMKAWVKIISFERWCLRYRIQRGPGYVVNVADVDGK